MKEIKINSSFKEQDSQSLSRYLTEISKIPLLSIEEEVELSIQIAKGDKIALERLVNANLRFVVSVSKKYQNRGLSLGDLINEGNIGLIKAASKFDHTRGFKFITFAVWWIRQMIMLAISQQTGTIRIPLNLVNSISMMNKVASNLEQVLERFPTQQEIADEIDLGEIKVKRYLGRAYQAASLDASINYESNTTMLEILPDSCSEPDEQFVVIDREYDLKQILNILSARERLILTLYYGLGGVKPINMNDISLRVKLSRERVRQLKDRAIKKLKLRSQKWNYYQNK